jgi:hypothetical protein
MDNARALEMASIISTFFKLEPVSRDLWHGSYLLRSPSQADTPSFGENIGDMPAKAHDPTGLRGRLCWSRPGGRQSRREMPQGMHKRLSFKTERDHSGAQSIMPCVDGEALADLVAEFERANHFEPAGGYGALIPGWFRFGPLDQYFLGQVSSGYWAGLGGVYLLGCECGELGCWPLKCRIDLAAETVIWTHFEQPHRPKRDYSRLGPFVFGRAHYESTLLELPSEFLAP